MEVRDILKSMRKEANMTSEKVAELCDCTPTTIRAIESGARLPSVPRFVSICNALRVSPNDLLKGELCFPINLSEKGYSERELEIFVHIQKLPIEKQELIFSVLECLIEKIGKI